MGTIIAGIDLEGLPAKVLLYFLIPLALQGFVLMIMVPTEARMPNARPPSSESAWFNVRYMIVSAALRALLRPLLIGAALMWPSVLGAGWITFTSSVRGWCFAFLAVLLMSDLLTYLFHRAQHAVPFLWRMHEFHHSAEHLDVTVGYRIFWIEPLIKMVFLYPLIGVVFKVPVTVSIAFAIVNELLNQWAHMNLRFSPGRFGLLIIHPQYHRLHHSRSERGYNKNFSGLLPLWDILFGTLCRPVRDEFVDVGLDSVVARHSLREALLWPWLRRNQTSAGPAQPAAR
jgi:sterol desaturase/sphingolipid hydroxylase (fatty acid hydroxylase superfamily)